MVRDKAKSVARPIGYPPGAGCATVRVMHARLTLAHRPETAMSGLMKTSHQLSFACFIAVKLTFALLCFVGSSGSAHAASVGAQSRPSSSPQVTSQFAIADFDGDRRPDFAAVQAGQSNSLDAQYWIAFQLSSGPRRTLSITAPTGGLHITSRDVNGDDSPDVLVTTAWTNRPVAVLLNDGQGNFRASSPSAFLGAFTTSERPSASTTEQVKDAAAAHLSRYPTGHCSEVSRFSPPQNSAGLLLPWAPRSSALSVVASFLGRAPPSFVLHI